MSDRIFQGWIKRKIIFKRFDNSLSTLDNRNVLTVDKTPFFARRAVGIILLFTGDIIDTTAETTTF